MCECHLIGREWGLVHKAQDSIAHLYSPLPIYISQQNYLLQVTTTCTKTVEIGWREMETVESSCREVSNLGCWA